MLFLQLDSLCNNAKATTVFRNMIEGHNILNAGFCVYLLYDYVSHIGSYWLVRVGTAGVVQHL